MATTALTLMSMFHSGRMDKQSNADQNPCLSVAIYPDNQSMCHNSASRRVGISVSSPPPPPKIPQPCQKPTPMKSCCNMRTNHSALRVVWSGCTAEHPLLRPGLKTIVALDGGKGHLNRATSGEVMRVYHHWPVCDYGELYHRGGKGKSSATAVSLRLLGLCLL